jgi:NitT/TauT family transport system substrate-binding protein
MDKIIKKLVRNNGFRVFIFAVLWVIVISALHYWRNVEKSDVEIIRMGYMPVITNLAAPLMDEASRDSEPRFSSLKYASFADMAESFRNGDIQVAFIIAPLPLVLRSQGVKVKIVYIGNRNESTFVANKALNLKRGDFSALAGRTIAVPMRYSCHNLAVHILLKRYNIPESSVNIVEMQPPDMASSVEAGNLDTYFVGEPFAAQTLRNGTSTLIDYAEDVWPGFICNLMIVSDEMIEKRPDMVRKIVTSAVRSNLWARQNIGKAAEIAAEYWGQYPELVKYAMTTPKDRIAFDMYRPKLEELKEIFDYMVEFDLIDRDKEWVLGELFDDSFTKDVDLSNINQDIKSILAN